MADKLVCKINVTIEKKPYKKGDEVIVKDGKLEATLIKSKIIDKAEKEKTPPPAEEKKEEVDVEKVKAEIEGLKKELEAEKNLFKKNKIKRLIKEAEASIK